jgi:hypothetical protein
MAITHCSDQHRCYNAERMRIQRFALASRVLGSASFICLVAFAVRMLAAAHLVPGNEQRNFYQVNEAARIAWAMVSGHGFSSPWPHTPLLPTAQQPPLYPWILAGIFSLTGAYTSLSLWIAVTLNAAFSSVTAIAILRLGQRVFTPLAGALAAWLWACWVYEVAVSIRLWESSLSALLLACGLFLVHKQSKQTSAGGWILFGVLWGVSSLCNTTLLPVFFVFWVFLWMVHRKAWPWRGALVSLGVCGLLIIPWTIRNYEAFGRVIPVRDNLGLELWIGNHEGVTRLYQFRSEFPLIDPTEYNQLGEVSFMDSKRALATQFIRQHPRQFLRLTGERFYNFWSVPTGYYWFPIALMSWCGLVFAIFLRGKNSVPYVVVICVFPVIYYVTHPWSTYRHPIEPEVLLLASYGVVEVGRAILRSRVAVEGIIGHRD